MDEIPRVSEVLYSGLCGKIGTPTEVTIRRDVADMSEKIVIYWREDNVKW
jgi:hypothetical protein